MSPRDREAEAFHGHLEAHDLESARALALGLLDEGVSVADVLREVVARAQVDVGERWHRSEYSVADEHAATAISDAVVSLLASERAPVTEEPHVVVVCVEGEWHLLPARLLVESLRADGFRVTFLGGSMPPAHLTDFLAKASADVVGLSCSTPLTLGGALSCIDAVHEAGLPVLAGGRGFGVDDRRASVLGADLWAPDASGAAELLRRPLPSNLREATADTGAAMELETQRDALVSEAMTELATRLPAFQHFDEAQRDRTREDLGYILRFAEAALLVRDEELFAEFARWLTILLDSRGLPPATVPMTFEILRSVTAGTPVVERLMQRVERDLAP